MNLKHDADGFLVGSPVGPFTLRGVIADTLGGFLVVRGYAKLSELAAFSFADSDYQRDLKPHHQADIQALYQRGECCIMKELAQQAIAISYN